MPHLVQMQEKFKDQGLVIITANMQVEDVAKDKHLKATVDNLQKRKVELINLIMEENEESLGKKVTIDAFPSAYVFDRQGRWTLLGGSVDGLWLEPKAMEELVEKLLKE